MIEIRANDGCATFEGSGEVVDVAVQMRRFPDGAHWREMLLADTLASHHIDAMAQMLAAFHHRSAVAPAASAFGSAGVHAQMVQGLNDTIRAPALRTWLAGLEAVGAICVRSDVERKRLFGLDVLASSRDRVPSGIYDATTTQRTYQRLESIADTALRSGWPVLVDAAFLRRTERASFASLAASLNAPFSIFDRRAAPPLLGSRILARIAGGADASEADLSVLEKLTGAAEPLQSNESTVVIGSDTSKLLSPSDLASGWLAAR